MAESDNRRGRRSLAVAAILLAAIALAGCSAVSGIFGRSPETATAPPGSDTKVEVATISGTTSIPVLVNDQPITRYDITQRVRLMKIGGVTGGEKAATDELIDEALQMSEAAKRGLRASDGRVEAAYASIASNLEMTPSQLTQALAGEGIDGSSFRKRLRAQITWQELVQRRAQATSQVKTSDVTDALFAKGDPDQVTMQEFVLQQIVFVVPGGSSVGVYDQRRREAEAFRQRFKGCDNSLEQARQLRGVVVKELGRRDASQLSGSQGEEIQKTPEGKTLRPTRTEQGIELVAVCSTRQIRSTAVARAQIETELFTKQSRGLGKDYLQELRERAVIEYR